MSCKNTFLISAFLGCFSICFSICFSAGRSFATAQVYESVVNPLRNADTVDYIQYQLKTAVNAVYKSGIRITRESSRGVSLQSPVACKPAYPAVPTKIYVERNTRQLGAETSIVEQLVINRCGDRKIIFTAERVGLNILPAEDFFLLSGNFPPVDGARTYDLSIAEDSLFLKRVFSPGVETMALRIDLLGTKDRKFEITVKEDGKVGDSFRQLITVVSLKFDRAIETYSIEYVWLATTRGRPVPRRFLYVEEQEVAPSKYLENVDDILSNGIYTLIPELVTRVVF